MSTQFSGPEPERRDLSGHRPATGAGRRFDDRGGRIAAEPCDGCGSVALQFIRELGGVNQYRCRRCRCRVFSAAKG